VIWLLTLAALGIAGACFAQYLARHGVVETPDSVVYEGTAANIRAGHGLTVPFTTVAVDVAPRRAITEAGRVPLVQFPPLFPLALAALGAFGLSPLDAARVLNPSLFGVNVFLLGLLVVSVVGERRWKWALAAIAVVAGGLPLFQRSPLLLLHGSVLSEPLMIALMLGGLLALIRYVRTQSMAWLATAAVLGSLATATRFLGVAMVLTVAIAAMAWGPARRAARLVAAGGALAIGVLPTAIVVLVNEERLHGHGHPPTIGSSALAVRQLATGVTQWFVPTTAPTLGRVALLFAVAALLVVAFRAQPPAFRLLGDDHATRKARPVVVLLAVTYLVVVFASRISFDQNVALEGRHLELLWLLVVVIAVDLIASAGHEAGVSGLSRWALSLGAAAVAIAVITPGVRQMPTAIRLGYRPELPQPSPGLTAAVRSVPRHTVIFSNLPDGIYEATGRPALMVPCRANYYTHGRNHSYTTDLGQLLTLVRRHRAALVLDTLSPLGEESCLDGHDAELRGLHKSKPFRQGNLFT
jgi:hypothetical protein